MMYVDQLKLGKLICSASECSFALEKYRYEQSLEHTGWFIEKLEKELEAYYEHVAQYKKGKEDAQPDSSIQKRMILVLNSVLKLEKPTAVIPPRERDSCKMLLCILAHEQWSRENLSKASQCFLRDADRGSLD
ncbi:hypothetical protein WN943_023103 [Citrus x changshan-huyou]